MTVQVEFIETKNSEIDDALEILKATLSQPGGECSFVIIPMLDYSEQSIRQITENLFNKTKQDCAIPIFIHFDIYEYCQNHMALRMITELFKDNHLTLQKSLHEKLLHKIEYLSSDSNKHIQRAKNALGILEKYKNKFGGSYCESYEEINNRIYNEAWKRDALLHQISAKENYEELFNEKTYISEKISPIQIEMLKQDYADCMSGLIDYKRWAKGMKILVIDNSPELFENPLKELAKIFDYNISYLKNNFLEFFKKLEKKNRGEKFNFKLTCDDGKERSLNEFDLILLDLHLGKDETTGQPIELTGQNILKEFIFSNPEIPVFILSSLEDTIVIRETLQKGADFYVPKSRLLSLPGRINNYFKEMGELLNEIEKKKLRQNVVGNLRKWRFNKNLLWFGDKCYHMINHSHEHAQNNWNIANQILPNIISYLSYQKELTNLTEYDVYCFCMAIWLHDIGHKGNERYGEPHAIRDVHGLISAELILKHPEHYGILGYEGNVASPYRWVSFRHPKTAPQVIRERIATLAAAKNISDAAVEKYSARKDSDNIQKMTILERIALICLYHKSNFPLDDDDVKTIMNNGKRIPLDCYENYDRETEPIHLKSICDLANDHNLMRLVALFRFIDGLDINRNRVGEEIQETIKTETIERDKKQQLFKLREEVHRLRDAYLKGTGKEKRFVTLFYENVSDSIMAEKSINKQMRKEQQQFLDTIDQNISLDNYYTLVDYIQFIAVQNGHFKLHNCISGLEIKPSLNARFDKIFFDFKYKTDKDKAHLESKDITVKEWREAKGRTIRDHLLGKTKSVEEFDSENKKTVKEYRIENGYVRREMNNGAKYLKDWFDLEKTKIGIYNSAGDKEIFKEEEQKP